MRVCAKTICDAATSRSLVAIAVLLFLNEPVVAATAEFEATATVTGVAAGCNGYASSFCDFFYEQPSQIFALTYPLGTPITFKYDLDTSAPDLDLADPSHGQYSAIKSGTVTVNSTTYSFGGPSDAEVFLQPGGSNYDFSKYHVRYDPASQGGRKVELVLELAGDSIYGDDGLPTAPLAPWNGAGTLGFEFSASSTDAEYIKFMLTGLRQVPEPSSFVLLICAWWMGALFRRKHQFLVLLLWRSNRTTAAQWRLTLRALRTSRLARSMKAVRERPTQRDPRPLYLRGLAA